MPGFNRLQHSFSLFSAIFTIVGFNVSALPTIANPIPPVYSPIPLSLGQEIKDSLSDRDIPTGQGGFARDYLIQLKTGDQIVIDLSSDVFDPMVVLMTKEGNPIAENDDGPDGTSNALLFTRIIKPGNYVIRVRSFGETAGGPFRLTVTPLTKAMP
jgi:hypothetical protein